MKNSRYPDRHIVVIVIVETFWPRNYQISTGYRVIYCSTCISNLFYFFTVGKFYELTRHIYDFRIVIILLLYNEYVYAVIYKSTRTKLFYCIYTHCAIYYRILVMHFNHWCMREYFRCPCIGGVIICVNKSVSGHFVPIDRIVYSPDGVSIRVLDRTKGKRWIEKKWIGTEGQRIKKKRSKCGSSWTCVCAYSLHEGCFWFSSVKLLWHRDLHSYCLSI